MQALGPGVRVQQWWRQVCLSPTSVAFRDSHHAMCRPLGPGLSGSLACQFEDSCRGWAQNRGARLVGQELLEDLAVVDLLLYGARRDQAVHRHLPRLRQPLHE